MLVEIRSPKVEGVLDGYRPMAGFFTTGRDLQRNEVTHAVLTVAGPDETTDLGFC